MTSIDSVANCGNGPADRRRLVCRSWDRRMPARPVGPGDNCVNADRYDLPIGAASGSLPEFPASET